MMTRKRYFALVLAAAFLSGARTALACACCTSEGQRNVGTVTLDAGKREQIESLRFGRKAKLFTGEADPNNTKGITAPASSYDISASWRDNRLVMTLRDGKGQAGTLALTLPNAMSLFEVDPRNIPDRGQGPTLYKEWKLSSPAAATGIFGPGGGPRQILTLIVQGHGNSCTDAADFSHWTLVMQGPQANYTLFGDLVTAR